MQSVAQSLRTSSCITHLSFVSTTLVYRPSIAIATFNPFIRNKAFSSFAAMATPSKKRKVKSNSASSSASSSPPPSNSRKKTKGESETPLAPSQVSRLSTKHPIWPAPSSTIAKATEFIKRASSSNETILLIPDKDADGLSAGMIMKRTLIHLGAKPESILEHHIPSGKNPASSSQREVLERYGARWIIVLDQGSPVGPPLVKGAEMGWQSDEEGAVRTMVLDHHYVTDLDKEGPQGSLLLNACKSEPVSTSALLAWVVCRPMWEEGSQIDYLAIIGTCGDLSINVKWDEPWPDFSGEVKRWGKSKLGTVVAMLNARECLDLVDESSLQLSTDIRLTLIARRTPMHDAIASWNALDASTNPIDILSSSTNPSFERLNDARNAVKEETEKCTHTPPRFSKVSIWYSIEKQGRMTG